MRGNLTKERRFHMKAFIASKEAEITAADTSVHSTLVYALGIAIEQEDDAWVKKDLEAVGTLLMGSEETIILTENWN